MAGCFIYTGTHRYSVLYHACMLLGFMHAYMYIWIFLCLNIIRGRYDITNCLITLWPGHCISLHLLLLHVNKVL